MGLYNIVNAASMVAGQPEDISQVLANFQAIQTVLNGGIDNSNINAAAAIAASKLAGYPANAKTHLVGDGSWPSTLIPYCRLNTAADIVCTTGTTTTLGFSGEYDPFNMHDPVTNNNRITVPQAGIYLALATAIITAAAAPALTYFRFRRNGAQESDSSPLSAVTTSQMRYTGSWVHLCAVNDYLDLAFYNGSSGSTTLTYAAGTSVQYAVVYLGAAT